MMSELDQLQPDLKATLVALLATAYSDESEAGALLEGAGLQTLEHPRSHNNMKDFWRVAIIAVGNRGLLINLITRAAEDSAKPAYSTQFHNVLNHLEKAERLSLDLHQIRGIDFSALPEDVQQILDRFRQNRLRHKARLRSEP